MYWSNDRYYYGLRHGMNVNSNCYITLPRHPSPPQGVCKSSLTNFQEISRIHFKNSRRFLHDKPYNIEMQVKFVMSINEHVMMSSDQCSSLWHPIHLLIYDHSDPFYRRTSLYTVYFAINAARQNKNTNRHTNMKLQPIQHIRTIY